MSSEEKFTQDQAENLRKRMEDNDLVRGKNKDVFSLPPRSETHNNEDKKVKFKIQYPLIRLLAVIFLLLVMVIPGWGMWKDRAAQVDNPVKQPEVEVEKSEPKEPIVKDEFELAEPEPVPIEEEQEQDQDVEPVLESPEEITEPEPVEEVKDEAPKQPEEQFIYHTVQEGETLFRVSQRYFRNRDGESLIKAINNLGENGTIYPGQKLKIPKQ